MDKLLELYNKVAAFKPTCKLNLNEKSIVFAFIKEFNKHLNNPYSLSICGRKPIIKHAERFLKAHGKL